MFLEGRLLSLLIITIILITHDTSAPDCSCTIKLTQIRDNLWFIHVLLELLAFYFFVNGSKLPVH